MKRMVSNVNCVYLGTVRTVPLATLFFISLWQNVWMDLIYTTLKFWEDDSGLIYQSNIFTINDIILLNPF